MSVHRTRERPTFRSAHPFPLGLSLLMTLVASLILWVCIAALAYLVADVV
jgi:Tfp pilus assembly protein PilV